MSQIERGSQASKAATQALAAALGIEDGDAVSVRRVKQQREPSDDRQGNDPLPVAAGLAARSMMIRTRRWQRPVVSGDFTWLGYVGGTSLLIVATDVEGRGARATLQAGYLRGFLDGFRSQLTLVPDLDSVADAIQACLRSTGIEAAFYVAHLRSVGPHVIAYQARGFGFPSPLLITGATHTTLPSLAARTPQEEQRHRLTAPWRLVLASDGLLQRLGTGSETRGVAALRRWLTGPARDEDPATFLSVSEPASDDEMFVELRWAGWDDVLRFDVTDIARRHEALERAASFVADVTRSAPLGRAATSAVAEALDNARHHGYTGRRGEVLVSFRAEGAAARIEIEDNGSGKIGQPGDGIRIMTARAGHVDRRYSERGGVIVSLTFKEERTDDNG